MEIENMGAIIEQLKSLAMTYGIQALGAIVVLIIGFWVVNKVTSVVALILKKKDFDETLRIYIGKMLGVILKILLLVAVAGMVGVETSSFVAIIGAAGLAVGLALQGSLSNFAGGVLILIFRPFKVGDYIIAQGDEGVVTAIDVFATTVTKLDNRRIIFPNGPLIGGIITNVSAEPVRRVDVSVGIGYGDDISKAQKVLVEMAKSQPKVLQDPAPMAEVVELGDNSVNFTFRTWCKNEDYWEVYFNMYKQTKLTLDANNISIPFPQRDVHIHNS